MLGLKRFVIFVAVLSPVEWLSEGCSSSSSCSSRHCTMGNWNNWSFCSSTCGNSGVRKRSRKKIVWESCGGKCPHSLEETSSCPNTCCPIDCQFAWQTWSPCSASCGYGKRTRQVKISSMSSCGGKDCPKNRSETMACGDGR